jgi:branched-chain amino acid transport system ATP-binding protein
MSENKEPILKVEDIHISFGGLKALNGVSLEVNPGEIMAIIGPNGAGKTTMLNVINGVYTPDEGRIFFEGRQRPLKMKPHHVAEMGIARTFQNLALFKGMDTWCNIMVGRTKKMTSNFFSQGIYWGMSQKEEIEHREAVEWIIDFLEIENIRKQPVPCPGSGTQAAPFG